MQPPQGLLSQQQGPGSYRNQRAMQAQQQQGMYPNRVGPSTAMQQMNQGAPMQQPNLQAQYAQQMNQMNQQQAMQSPQMAQQMQLAQQANNANMNQMMAQQQGLRPQMSGGQPGTMGLNSPAQQGMMQNQANQIARQQSMMQNPGAYGGGGSPMGSSSIAQRLGQQPQQMDAFWQQARLSNANMNQMQQPQQNAFNGMMLPQQFRSAGMPRR